MEGIHFQHPTWFIGLCLLAGLLYALFLYFKSTRFKEAHPYLHILLGILRFLSVSAICILLLSPFIKSLENTSKDPFILFLEDASESVTYNSSEVEINSFKTAKNNLLTAVAEKYELKKLKFGDEVVESNSDSLSYQVTNISEALNYVEENYGDQNIGAIILSSDGIFNEGSNPLYSAPSLKAPLYTIALGDTTRQKDLYIKNIFANKIAYLGDQFSVQIDIQAQNCTGVASQLNVYRIDAEGKRAKLKTDNISIKSNDFFTTKEYILDANHSGVNKYLVTLSPISGEISETNNRKNFFIEVLDARQKILLFANAPHPDIAAFKTVLGNNKNYELDVIYAGKKEATWNDYNLVLFHDLPSQDHSIDLALQALNRKKTPRMFVVGAKMNLPKFNQVQDNVEIKGNSIQNNDVQGNVDPNFSLFTLDNDLLSGLKNFSPLTAPFGDFVAGPATKVFLYQRIKKINTEYPLLSFSEINGIKTTVLAAEGIWKWRLYDFLENGNHELTNYVIDKTIQYTSIKEDKRKFRVASSKKVYKENEAVYLEAQLFNNTYESINTPDVFVSIFDGNNKEFKYTFSRKDNYYVLNPGFFKEGSYRFKANVNSGGIELKDQGRFSVKTIELELYDLTARHDVLNSLSEKYGGTMHHPSNLDQLQADLVNNESIKPVIYSTTKTQSVLNLKWLFFALMTMLCLEWFIRRYNGSY